MPMQSANWILTTLLLWSTAVLLPNRSFAADSEPAPSANPASETNIVALIEAQYQDLIRKALEQIRREATLASQQVLEQASHNAEIVAQRLDETLATRLGTMERFFEEQHRQDLEAMQNSNRTLLLIAAIFSVVGVVGILIAAAIIVRAMNRLSEVALSLPASHLVGHGPAPTVLNAGDLSVPGLNQLDQASIRFLGAIERLEKRIHELEMTARPSDIDVDNGRLEGEMKSLNSPAAHGPMGNASVTVTATGPAGTDSQPRSAAAEASDDKTAQAAILIGKGQALMSLGQAEEALACFETAILIDSQNADALVKKGMALEKLQKMEEALASYDRAIATNSSLTLAYLYKGAVCNRLQRFREALECYEKALKTEQRTVPS